MSLFDWMKPKKAAHAKRAEPEIDFGALREDLRSLVRPCWDPVVVEGEGAPADSRFGGAPGLLQGETWPACGHCHGPLAFFLQMNLGACPGAFGGGLLQLFYCLSESCEISFEPYAKGQRVRIVDPSKIVRSATMILKDLFPARRVTGWSELKDLPNGEELEDLGIELTKAEEKSLERLPHSGDKLGGWPCWVQGVEYPKCPTCGQTMKLLFQLDSEDNVPYMWGDVGCGHITQCPDHSDILAFGWDCC